MHITIGTLLSNARTGTTCCMSSPIDWWTTTSAPSRSLHSTVSGNHMSEQMLTPKRKDSVSRTRNASPCDQPHHVCSPRFACTLRYLPPNPPSGRTRKEVL